MSRSELSERFISKETFLVCGYLRKLECYTMTPIEIVNIIILFVAVVFEIYDEKLNHITKN